MISISRSIARADGHNGPVTSLITKRTQSSRVRNMLGNNLQSRVPTRTPIGHSRYDAQTPPPLTTTGRVKTGATKNVMVSPLHPSCLHKQPQPLQPAGQASRRNDMTTGADRDRDRQRGDHKRLKQHFADGSSRQLQQIYILMEEPLLTASETQHHCCSLSSGSHMAGRSGPRCQALRSASLYSRKEGWSHKRLHSGSCFQAFVASGGPCTLLSCSRKSFRFMRKNLHSLNGVQSRGQ